MHNDSIETLLLRHYGRNASAPAMLEQRLVASVRREAAQQSQEQRMAVRIREYRVSRRRAVKLVAISSAGLGLLSAGLASIKSLEDAVSGQESRQQPAYS